LTTMASPIASVLLSRLPTKDHCITARIEA
jgi:hypothetical protein